MSEKREVVLITRLEYHPHEWEWGSNEQPLLVFMRCVNRKGKVRDLTVTGTVPRFWTERSLDEARKAISGLPQGIGDLVVDSTEDGAESLREMALVRIDVRYPWAVPKVRDVLEPHYQADVTFEDAVRYFYGWRSCVSVPVERSRVHVDDVLPVEHDPSIRPAPYILDIEVADENAHAFAEPAHPTQTVRCVTLMHLYTGEAWVFSTGKVDKARLRAMLSDAEWLMRESDASTKPPPLESGWRLHVKTFEPDRLDRWADESAERQLFETFYRWLQRFKPTHLIAHNADYDTGYLHQRAKVKNKGVAKWNRKHPDEERREWFRVPEWKSVQVWCSLKNYETRSRKSGREAGSGSLEWISGKELGYGKLKHGGYWDTYSREPTRFAAYNVWDCELVRRWVLKLNILDTQTALAAYMGCDFSKANSEMWAVESLLFHTFRDEHEAGAPLVVLPSRKFVERGDRALVGGHVQAAPCGLFRNMLEVDNTQEYPSVIIGANMGVRTRVRVLCDVCTEAASCKRESRGYVRGWDECKEWETERPVSTLPSGNVYLRDVADPIPDNLRTLSDERDVIKALMDEAEERGDEAERKRLKDEQFIRKVGMNAFYGVLGSGTTEKTEGAAFRCADSEIAGDITEVARLHEAWNKERIEERTFVDEEDGSRHRFVVHYQDTDSCKLEVVNEDGEPFDFDFSEKFLRRVGTWLAAELNSTFDAFALEVFGHSEHRFAIKLEDTYLRYLQWGRKKFYAYVTHKTGKVKLKGIDRSDVPPFKAALHDLFFGVMLTGSGSLLDARDKVQVLIDELESGEHDHLAGRPIRLNKKGNPAWRAARYSNTYLGTHLALGDKVIVYPVKAVRGCPRPPNGRVALEWGEHPKDHGLIVDTKEVFAKQIRKPLSYYLDAFGLTFDQFMQGREAGTIVGDEW